MIDRLFTLGLLAAGALLPCMERLRATDPRRRTLLLAAASLAGLAAFQPLRGAPTDLGAAPLAAPSSLLAAAGSAIALFAVGMAWNAILADSRRRSARWATLGLGAASLALGLCASGPGVWVALPLALRTGWARGLDRRWPTIVAVLAGLAALIAWPALPERGACWPPGCDWGLALARFARLFLGLQLALLAVRLAFGVVFGPRRIGRRLLASHLVIGVLPVVLTGFFVTVTALLAIASLRASLAGRILVLHHELTQELAASRLAAVAARAGERASGWHEDPEELTDLARRLAEDWGPAASWRSPAPPADPPDPLQGSRLMIALSAFPATGHSPADDGAAARPAGAFPATGTPPSSPEGGAPAPPGPGRAAFAPPPASILGASVLVELTRDPRLPPTLLGRIHSVAGDSLRASGDAARLASLPPPQAWALRPAPGGGAGLIKAHGLTLHAADALAEAGGVLLRAQVIEELPRGRTRPLETLLAEGARIEERMHWSLSLDPGARRTQVTLATDTLAAFGPGGSRVS
ncbi:MAG: hypothetical protein FJY75_13790, partial [Candidatus Eisenbacteria bacterium]|nr:hypothetical protein [Candidatus Eisenbacteria bacterium]